MRTVRYEKPYLRDQSNSNQISACTTGSCKSRFWFIIRSCFIFVAVMSWEKNRGSIILHLLYAHVVDYHACVHILPFICLSVSIEYTDSVYWVGSQAGGAASRCLDMDSKQQGYTIGREACSTKQDYICESRLHFSSACIEYTCIYLVAFIAFLLIFGWLVTTCEDLSCLRVEHVSGLIRKQYHR